MSSPTWRGAFRLISLVLALAACNSAAVQPRAGNGAGGSGPVPNTAVPSPPPSTDPGLAIPDAGAPAATPPPAEACATEFHRAEQLPLDLLLLVDASSSMDQMSGTETKWTKIRAALTAFVQDPASAGLGVGLSFFPSKLGSVSRECNADADCVGIADPKTVHPCSVQGVCYAPGYQLENRLCAPNLVNSPFNCAAGLACVRRGKCSMSGALCAVQDAPCEGGANDRCQLTPGICRVPDEDCAVAKPGQLDVELGDLPGHSGAIVAALAARMPDGSTPMTRASDMALTTLATRAQSHPGRRTALVLATDGLPNACGLPEPLTGVSDRLAQGRAGQPSISTYVVGVFAPMELGEAQPALQTFATAGGTKAPFVLTTGDDLSQRLLDALKEIRGLALACEYNIPSPKMGQLDFGKVNVRTTQAGSANDLAYVGSVDRCRADTGGWFYDVMPTPAATAPQPQRLVICPASCARLQSDAGARVDLVFGCATRTID
jgi:hypothetical protein